MTETPSGSGTYVGTTEPLFPHHGAAHTQYTLHLSGGTTQPILFDMYIDPSGVVKSTTGHPITGATVTLYRSDYITGPFSMVPQGDALMSPSNRQNPDKTDADGRFGWML